MENPAIGVAVCDLQCVIQYANRAFESLTGIDPGRAAGQALLRMATALSLEGILDNLRRACVGEPRAFAFHGAQPATGHPFSALFVALPLPKLGPMDGIVCLVFTTTQTADPADYADHAFVSALTHLGEGVAMIDATGHVLWANPALTRITGFDAVGAVGGPLPFLSANDSFLDRARFALARNKYWQGEVLGVSASGTVLFLQISLSAIPDATSDNEVWLLMFSDRSQHQAYTTRLERLVQHDALTGLLNREAFRDRVLNGLYRSRSTARLMVVLFLDLDGFKAVNDTVGHEAGDRVLRQVAKRLFTVAGQANAGVDVARLSGDEFAMLIPPQTDPLPFANQFCRAVLDAFADPFIVLGQLHRLSASIGGCLGPFGHETASDLLHHADQAMYRIKQLGGQDFFIQPCSTETENSVPIVAIDFEHALQRQQFNVYFQPVVNLHTGEIVAIEGRVRWSDGKRPPLTAKEVLQAASTAQDHWLLDLAVFEQAIHALDQLREVSTSNLLVAINISIATCITHESVVRLEAFLASAGESNRFRLEFPLEAFLSAPSIVVPLVQRLASRRYSIAVDHVYTPDLKMAHLDQAPLQMIKLHEELVEQAPGDALSADRICAISLAAQRQGLFVGVEGVVRLEQLEFLRKAGCHQGQGTLISRPQPVNQLLALLRKGRCW